MALYDADGKIQTTEVAGTSYTGLYAADGSWNVVVDPAGVTGIHHPCGALNATRTGATYFYSPSGFLNLDYRSFPPVVSFPELITDPNMDNPSAWVTSGSVSITGGKAVWTANGFINHINLVLTPGTTYRLTYVVDSYTSGTIQGLFIGGTAVNGTAHTAAGTFTDDLVAGASSNGIRLNGTNTAVLSITSVSLKQLA